jgi:hypothetical protein
MLPLDQGAFAPLVRSNVMPFQLTKKSLKVDVALSYVNDPLVGATPPGLVVNVMLYVVGTANACNGPASSPTASNPRILDFMSLPLLCIPARPSGLTRFARKIPANRSGLSLHQYLAWSWRTRIKSAALQHVKFADTPEPDKSVESVAMAWAGQGSRQPPFAMRCLTAASLGSCRAAHDSDCQQFVVARLVHGAMDCNRWH